LTLTANEADNDASATNNSAGVNLVNVAETAAKATINGATKVHIDQGASIDVASLTSKAFAHNEASAGANYAGVSGVNINLADVDATTNHAVSSYLGPEVGTAPDNSIAGKRLKIGDATGLNLDAESENIATVEQVEISGAVLKVQKVQPE